MTLEEVKEKWNAATSFSIIPDPEKFKKYPDSYIFDEDKSVRWNREEVIVENANYDKEGRRLRDKLKELNAAAWNASIDYILEEYEFNRDQAVRLWGFVSNKYSSYSIDTVFIYLDEYADFAKDMIDFGITEVAHS